MKSPAAAPGSERLSLEGLAERIERIGETALTRADLQSHLDSHAALAAAAEALQHQLETIAARVDRLGESEIARRELAKHVRQQATTINQLDEQVSKLSRKATDGLSSARDALKQLRQQAEVQGTSIASVDARLEDMAKNVAREIKRMRDVLGKEAPSLERRERLDSLAERLAQLTERVTEVAEGGQALRELLDKGGGSGDGQRQQQRRVLERIEIQSALIETLKAQVGNLAASARNTTAELQRAREAREILARELRQQARAIEQLLGELGGRARRGDG